MNMSSLSALTLPKTELRSCAPAKVGA